MRAYSPAAVTAALLDHRFLFVVGKGGVGKSTVSAALALAAARRGKRVLVAMCNGKERLSQLLETEPIGQENVPILPGIEAVNMTPQAALREYGEMTLRVRALYAAVFENRLVGAFLRGVPGLEAWALLGKAYYHTTEETAGLPRYDLVILDAPATGHALDMLRVPQVLTDIAPPGPLRREAEAAIEMLRDPARSSVVLVTLPEDMPTNETIELHDALTSELRLPVKSLVVNQVLPELFSNSLASVVTELGPSATPTELRPLLAAGSLRAHREAVQRESMAKLGAQLPLPGIQLPYLFVPEFGRSSVDALSQAF